MWKTALRVMICYAALAVPGAFAADMTARQVTRLLFTVPAGSTPDLSNKDLSGLDLSGLDFKKAKLDGVNFYGSDLTRANLSGASLKSARLDRATLIGADLSRADLSGASLLRPNVFEDMKPSSRSGLSFAGARARRRQSQRPFRRREFQPCRSFIGDFRPARSARRSLDHPDDEPCRPRTFIGARLVGANLARNSLENANFTGADLTRANLRGARLGGANFSEAILDGADLTGATMPDANLKSAHGLKSAIGLAATR